MDRNLRLLKCASHPAEIIAIFWPSPSDISGISRLISENFVAQRKGPLSWFVQVFGTSALRQTSAFAASQLETLKEHLSALEKEVKTSICDELECERVAVKDLLA